MNKESCAIITQFPLYINKIRPRADFFIYIFFFVGVGKNIALRIGFYSLFSVDVYFHKLAGIVDSGDYAVAAQTF